MTNELILVPAVGDERSDVATWLIATAQAKGISSKLILTRNEGFLVPAELLDPEVVLERIPVPEPYDPGPDNVTATPPAADPDRETIRAWAKANGYDVAEKGQLKRSVYDAYVFAHAGLS